MKLQYQNVIWKVIQSSLGLFVVAIQAQFLSEKEIATVLIAQGLLSVVSFFDFGLGVRITTYLVETFEDNSVPSDFRRELGQRLLYKRQGEIFRIAIIQSLVFGISFTVLNYNLTSNLDFVLGIIFSSSVFFHSLGNNFGKLTISTGEINHLVRMQSFGAFLAMCGGLIALTTNFSVEISILALCFSSVLIGSASMWPFKASLKSKPNSFGFVIANLSQNRKIDWSLNLQVSQLFQFLQPLLIQYIVINSFESSVVVAYLICQRIFGAIGNALSSETQLNYTLVHHSDRYSLDDVIRFKNHLLAFLIVGFVAVFTIINLWNLFFPTVRALSDADLLSYVFLGLCIFIDQAVRIRLYVLNLFFREMIANVLFNLGLLLMFLLFFTESVVLLNSALICGYLLKFFVTSNIWERFGK